nr:MAG TPA: hypothetical protein [Bacteriophage sp.]
MLLDTITTLRLYLLIVIEKSLDKTLLSNLLSYYIIYNPLEVTTL